MFSYCVAVTLIGYFLVIIPYSLAMTKTWIQNNNWETVKNWNLGRLPCSRDIAKIELEETAVFINTSSTVKELVLPSSGSLVLGNSAQLLFSDGNSSQECDGSTISFTGSGTNNWFDPNNWRTKPTSGIPFYARQVPCKYDDVRFPKDSTYNVEVTKNVTVSKIFISEQAKNEDEFQHYVASNKGIQQINLKEPVSFHITGEECEDRSGCTCGNSKLKEYICNFVTCPKRQCKSKQITPFGGCCPICGTIVVLHISVGFEKDSVEKRIQDYLSEFSGVAFTAEKTEDMPNRIQVILGDTTNPSDEESRTRNAAKLIRKKLLDDKYITKIEILPEEPSSSKSSSNKRLTFGLTIGVPISAVFVIVLIVVYIVTRRKPTNSTTLTNDADGDEDVHREDPNVLSESINPLYDMSMEMENIEFNDPLDPPVSPGNNGTSERENPLYEAGVNLPEETN